MIENSCVCTVRLCSLCWLLRHTFYPPFVGPLPGPRAHLLFLWQHINLEERQWSAALSLLLNTEQWRYLHRRNNCSPFSKKGSRTDCANCMGINLVPTTSKLLVSVILPNLRNKCGEHTREKRVGLHKGYWRADQNFTFRQLLERHCTFQKPTNIVLLEVRADFDLTYRNGPLYVEGKRMVYTFIA